MKTLTDLFDKADKPDNIYVGICHQNKNKNEYCIPNNFKHMDHIRFKDYDYKEALVQHLQDIYAHIFGKENNILCKLIVIQDLLKVGIQK